MTSKEYLLIPLFEQFIKDSYKGKRLKPDGRKIRPQTVDNYVYVLQHLKSYEQHHVQILRIKIIGSTNKKLLTAERNYWKKFYLQFTQYLFKKGCYDNYVGNVVKVIRVFFNYVQRDKLLKVGDFYKSFYVTKEEVPIITLLPEQLRFLIYEHSFEQTLTPALQCTKDVFVFGCTVALRSSDLFAIRFSDIEQVGHSFYLSIRTIKTDTPIRMKLPAYAVAIIDKFKQTAKTRKTIFPPISKNQFNKNVKRLAELAGWTQELGKSRSRRGKYQQQVMHMTKKQHRFCDLLSSHTMRRTAITTMLMLGMPEHIVRKISGHAANSKAFYRYVNLVQSYLDHEVDKVFDKLGGMVSSE